MGADLSRADKFMKLFLWSIFGPLAVTGSQILLTGLQPVLNLETKPYLEVSSRYLLPLTLTICLVSFVAWVALLAVNRRALNGRTWRSYFIQSYLTPVILKIIESIPGTKRCAICHEFVREQATLCKHCGSAI